MGQKLRGRNILAAMKDVPIRYRLEDFVTDMVQRERLAVMKDVPIMLLMEEFV